MHEILWIESLAVKYIPICLPNGYGIWFKGYNQKIYFASLQVPRV